MKKISMQAVVLSIFTLMTLAACSKPTDPVFENGWVRAMPPGSKMTAGFGTLKNVTAATIEIESVSSPWFRDISLHRTEDVNGVSRMREVEEIVLAAGESLEMAPGGYHLMLMMPTQSIVPGRMVPLEFKAADGRVFSFEAAVERR